MRIVPCWLFPTGRVREGALALSAISWRFAEKRDPKRVQRRQVDRLLSDGIGHGRQEAGSSDAHGRNANRLRIAKR
jgi:hypothetical protein